MGKAETLLQIKDAEAKAKRMIEEADEKQRSMIASARKEAMLKIQTAERDLKAKSEASLEAERRIIASERDDLLKKGNNEAAQLGARAKDRIPRAKSHLKLQFERTFDAATGTNE